MGLFHVWGKSASLRSEGCWEPLGRFREGPPVTGWPRAEVSYGRRSIPTLSRGLVRRHQSRRPASLYSNVPVSAVGIKEALILEFLEGHMDVLMMRLTVELRGDY